MTKDEENTIDSTGSDDTDILGRENEFLKSRVRYLEDFKSFIGRSSSAFCAASLPNGEILEAGDAFLRIFELSSEKFLGSTIGEIGLADAFDSVKERFAQGEEEVTLENVEVFLSGTDPKYFSLAARKTVSNGVDCVLMSLCDLTQTSALKKDNYRTSMFFRKMFYSHKAVMLIIDVEENRGEIIDANPAASEFYGYSVKDLRGMNIFEINVLGDDFINDAMEKVLAFKQKKFRFVHRLSSGELRQVDTLTTSLDYFGKKVFFSIIVDVTQDEENKEKLLRSEEKYRNLIDNILEISFILDFGGKVLFVSDQVYNQIGYKPREILGEPLDDFLAPKYRKPLREILAENRKSLIEIELEFETKTGPKKWFRVSGKAVKKAFGEYSFQIIAANIHARKTAEEKLLESVQKTSFFIANIPLAYMEWNLDSVLVEWNGAAENIFGYSKSEAVGKRVDKLLMIDYKKTKADSVANQLIESPAGLNTTERYKTKNGDEIVCDWYLRLVRAESGESTGVIALARDVTHRAALEEEVRRSREWFKRLFEEAPDAYYLNDLKGSFIDGNEAAEKLIGYKKEELIGKNFAEFNILPPKSLPKALKNLSKHAFGVRTGPDELELRRKDGSFVNVEITAAPFKIDGKRYVLGIARDITEKIESKKLLAQREELLSTLMQTIPIPIFYKDLELRFIDGNEAFFEFFELKPSDIIGKTGFDIWDRDYAREFNEADLKTLNERSLQIDEYDLVDKFGNPRYLIDYKTVYYDEEARPAGLIGAVIDVTKQKETQKKLTEALAEKDRFISIIAHDLRSPISGFLGLAKMLNQDFKNLDMNELTEISGAMFNSANAVYKLLENLLEWSKIKRGIFVFQPKIYFLKELIYKTLDIVKSAAEAKEITVVDETEDLKVFADERAVSGALRNLISNALKFSEEGGEIRLFTEDYSENMAKISVVDFGIGMSPETVDNLFRLDKNASRTGTDGEKGSGLGLILAKELIEMNGGEIFVESQEGKGSTFAFTVAKQTVQMIGKE